MLARVSRSLAEYVAPCRLHLGWIAASPPAWLAKVLAQLSAQAAPVEASQNRMQTQSRAQALSASESYACTAECTCHLAVAMGLQALQGYIALLPLWPLLCNDSSHSNC